MDNSFFAYLQQLELMAFFSGYPIIYAIVMAIAGKKQVANNFRRRTGLLLPYAYALAGLLFLGLQLQKLYPDYSVGHITSTLQHPWLVLWGLFSLLFFIPALAKEPVLSLLHSLVFFFFLIKDLALQYFASAADANILKNDMHIYTSSLILNASTFALVLLMSFIYSVYKRRLR